MRRGATTDKEVASLSFLDKLVSDLAPAAQDFEVLLPKGHKLGFRVVRDYSEFTSLKNSAAVFGRMFAKPLPGEWSPFKGTSPDIAAQCHFLSSISLQEELQEVKAWLRIAKEAGLVLATVLAAVDEQFGATEAIEEVEGVQAAGEESAETSSSETA